MKTQFGLLCWGQVVHAYYQTNYTFSSKAKRCVIVYPINCSARHLDTAPILTQKFCRSASCSVSLTLFLSSFLSTLPLFPDSALQTHPWRTRDQVAAICVSFPAHSLPLGCQKQAWGLTSHIGNTTWKDVWKGSSKNLHGQGSVQERNSRPH